MTPAESARRNAIPLELKKDAMRQVQSGDWKVTFTVQASDMDERLMKAAMGTRFQAALVEIGDDESPVQQQPAKELSAPEPHSGRTSWHGLSPAKQAGIRCGEKVFQSFLNEECGFDVHHSEQAAIVVRQLCQVESRSELNKNGEAILRWRSLEDQYQAWKLTC